MGGGWGAGGNGKLFYVYQIGWIKEKQWIYVFAAYCQKVFNKVLYKMLVYKGKSAQT